jgi:hypothetical protein
MPSKGVDACLVHMVRYRAPKTWRCIVGYQRIDVEFPSGGLRCAAWLYMPEGRPRPPVERVASKAPLGKLHVVDADHFDVYTGTLFQELSELEAGFFAENLLHTKRS